MNQRENVLALFRRQPHDFIPVQFNLCPSLIERYQKETGSDQSYVDYFDMPWRDLKPLRSHDMTNTRFLKYHPVIDQDTVIDDWGVGHRSTPTSMHMTQMLYPLENVDSVEEIQEYPLPIYDDRYNPDLKAEVEAIHQSGHASLGNMQCTIWESAWYMRGMENLMMDMMSDDPMADALLDLVMENALSRALMYARAGTDIIFLGDDIGMQQSIMMSESLYCDWLKPRIKHIIDEVRKVKPDTIILYHSCGYITPFIPHLMEVGVDVLNPIQPECMDFGEIYDQFGGKLSFHGTIGTQTTMPFGTPEEVRQTVEKHLDIASKHGGLFPAPTHLLEPEVPWENIIAYVDACRGYSRG